MPARLVLYLSAVFVASMLCRAEVTPDSQQNYTDPDAYDVLSTVVSTYARDNGITHLVIAKETKPLDERLNGKVEKWKSFFDPDHQRSWQILAREYERVNEVPRRLLPKLSLAMPYEFEHSSSTVAEAEVSEESPKQAKERNIEWRTNPVVRVSAVAFNETKTLALVSIEHFCGPKCGRSQLVLPEKTSGTWKEVPWSGSSTEMRY